ncbi:maltokinase N-terminal cap-like domain-containing protein [Nocardioides sp. AE5]|uniref:maltokinase N-terminal cap-like domain-containing protein n=1 Tax=Nocardioides sp. AE5 TaxID=2962573 RepID=UPI0028829BEE|nr:hypothetical protein [Nocardioides sp. AE5]MDT0201034.1 hypothetical protein [Nocardioides sp. AE5]
MRPGLRHFLHTADWFVGAEQDFTVADVRRVGALPLPEEGPAVVVDLVTVTFPDGTSDRYQVLVSLRPSEDERLAAALIGVWEDPDHGRSHAYDAIADPEAMAQVIAAFAQAALAGDPAPGLGFHRIGEGAVNTAARARAFTGKQSNSLVAFGDESMFKLFRRVEAGPNPDVELPRALTAAGSGDVAAMIGWLDTVDEPTGQVLHLAVLQEFLDDSAGGWDLATAAVRTLCAEASTDDVPPTPGASTDVDFSAEAPLLGAALLRVHGLLADAFTTDVLSGTEAANLCSRMQQRLLDALGVVPELAGHRDGLSAIFERVRTLDGVRVQRVHGDLHLGQALRTGEGWRFIDFEGEPELSLADRLRPDSVWADVASMVRSLDYAANVVARVFPGAEDVADAWARDAAEGFLAAYAPEGLSHHREILLDAYLAERAVIECVHEATHRPTWLPIPLRGIERLVADRA